MGVTVSDLKGDGSAWITIRNNGKRTRKKIGDWEKAEEIAAEIRQRLFREAAGLPKPLPLREVLKEHELLHVANLKKSTRILQRGQIHNHLIPELGEVDARDLSEAHLVQFIAVKLRTHSPSFVRGTVNVLKKALRLVRRAYPDVPELQVDLGETFQHAETSRATEIREIDSLTHEEAERLLTIAHEHEPRWYPIFLLMI